MARFSSFARSFDDSELVLIKKKKKPHCSRFTQIYFFPRFDSQPFFFIYFFHPSSPTLRTTDLPPVLPSRQVYSLTRLQRVLFLRFFLLLFISNAPRINYICIRAFIIWIPKLSPQCHCQKKCSTEKSHSRTSVKVYIQRERELESYYLRNCQTTRPETPERI